MRQAGSARRLLPVALFVAAWLSIGLAVPLMVSLGGDHDTVTDSAVVAAPRHEARIHKTVTLDRTLGIWLNRGRVVLQMDPDKALDLIQRDALITSGEARYAIRDAKLTLFSDPPEVIAPADDTLHAPIIDGLRTRGYRSLSLENSKIVLDLPSGEPFVLRNADATIEPRANSGTRLSGKGTWYGTEIAFSVNVIGAATRIPPEPQRADNRQAGREDKAAASPNGRSESSPGKRADAPKPEPSGKRQRIEIDLKSKLFSFQFAGHIDTIAEARHFTGTANLETADAPAFLTRLMPGLPGKRIPKTLTLGAHANWTGDGAQLHDVKLDLAEQSAVGTLGMRHAHNRPQLTGTLDFDILDLASFNTETQDLPFDLTDFHTVAMSATRLWDRLQTAFRTPIWRDVDVDLRLSADQLRYADAELGRTAAAITLVQGVMKTHVVEFAFAGGTGNGQVSIDFNKPASAMSFRGRIDNVDSQRTFASLVGFPAVQGPANVTFDLDVLNPLAGVAITDMLRGKVVFETLVDKTALRLNLAKLASVEDRLPLSSIEGATPVKRATAEFALLNGRVYCRKGKIQLDDRSFTVNGWFDLSMPQVDFIISEKMTPADATPDKPASTGTAAKAGQAANNAGQAAPDDLKPEESAPRRWRLFGANETFTVARHPLPRPSETHDQTDGAFAN
jgi:hypothetical protein